jgi:hypothetical protein
MFQIPHSGHRFIIRLTKTISLTLKAGFTYQLNSFRIVYKLELSGRQTKVFSVILRFFDRVVHQYSETYVTHFLFNLSRIKGLCMFRALLAHPQKALQQRHLVYCVRVMFHFNPGAAN